MNRPEPLWVMHITHLEHLASIVEGGLICDRLAQGRGVIRREIGNTEIKAGRSGRQVPVPPGGVVADYVPFYFAPRSPMLFAIHRGNVPTYQDGCDRIVYLCATLPDLQRSGGHLVATDRNAALNYARFTADMNDLDDLVDWPLMEKTYWNNTADYPDRRERRMAELLVHRHVPWSAITLVAAKSNTVIALARAQLTSLNSRVQCDVRPHWYF